MGNADSSKQQRGRSTMNEINSLPGGTVKPSLPRKIGPILLWDIDGMLLDFHASERAAIRTLFEKYGFGECTDAMLTRYAAINDVYWQKLERGEMAKADILVNRYVDFFREYGLDETKAPAFNADYQLALGDTIVFMPGAEETVKALKGRYFQAAVTNGTLTAQTKKLRNSGLDRLLDAFYISDRIGFEKPDIRYFNCVFQQMPAQYAAWQKENGGAGEILSAETLKAACLMIGDSLTSDIQGGNNAGIRTVWFNPSGKEIKPGYHVDHMIRDVREIFDLLEE